MPSPTPSPSSAWRSTCSTTPSTRCPPGGTRPPRPTSSARSTARCCGGWVSTRRSPRPPSRPSSPPSTAPCGSGPPRRPAQGVGGPPQAWALPRRRCGRPPSGPALLPVGSGALDLGAGDGPDDPGAPGGRVGVGLRAGLVDLPHVGLGADVVLHRPLLDLCVRLGQRVVAALVDRLDRPGGRQRPGHEVLTV